MGALGKLKNLVSSNGSSRSDEFYRAELVPRDQIEEAESWRVQFEKEGSNAGWYVKGDLDGHVTGPFPSQERAIEVAQDLPQNSDTIDVRDRGGYLRTVDRDADDPEIFENVVWTVRHEIDDFDGQMWVVDGAEPKRDLPSKRVACGVAYDRAEPGDKIMIQHKHGGIQNIDIVEE